MNEKIFLTKASTDRCFTIAVDRKDHLRQCRPRTQAHTSSASVELVVPDASDERRPPSSGEHGGSAPVEVGLPVS
ncbi:MULTISPECIES: hypothetical protein [unclassified Streptosporangium]|uniref:hypothetical protein n=1 Tax=Streptosporangium sp. NPDC005286 TaxID=3154463 RepID=UPI0033A52128